MRTYFVTLLLSFMACTITGNATAQSNLNGTWVPIKQEMGGTALQPQAFEKQKLTLKDTTYTFVAESVDKGVIKFKDGKMDIYGKDGVNEGKHFTAIYKLENNLLTVCYNLLGDSYPENFDTKENPMYFLSVFKKE
jgi:uncharacterized protein (TIGR03067 family)